MSAQPLTETQMTPEAALAAAGPLADGRLLRITWPTDPKREWSVAFDREGDPATVSVADPTGETIRIKGVDFMTDPYEAASGADFENAFVGEIATGHEVGDPLLYS